MRRVRVLGVGSDDKPLLRHRREAVPVEVNPALDPDRRAKRRRLHRSVGQERQDPLDDHRVAALQLQGESPRRVQSGIRLRRRGIRPAAKGTKGSELTDTVLVIQQLMSAHTPDAASSDVRDRFGR